MIYNQTDYNTKSNKLVQIWQFYFRFKYVRICLWHEIMTINLFTFNEKQMSSH